VSEWGSHPALGHGLIDSQGGIYFQKVVLEKNKIQKNGFKTTVCEVSFWLKPIMLATLLLLGMLVANVGVGVVRTLFVCDFLK
jgi:hypothetical protein